MKKFALVFSFLVLACTAQYLTTTHAAAFPPALGGTGSSAVPSSGQTLIGNSSGVYVPAYFVCAGGCTIATSSGGITITAASSSAILTNTGNWAGAWHLLNPSDFLSSSTQYVSSVNGQSGAVSITFPATSTINGTQAGTFYLVGDGNTVTTTVSGATTTFRIINTGNWAGTWQGVNSSTFYQASNPNGYISSAPATATIGGAAAPFNFGTAFAGSVFTITTSTSGGSSTIVFTIPKNLSAFTNDAGLIATNTGNWAGTWQGVNSSSFYLATNPSGFISAAITSINGMTNAAYHEAAGTGLSLATSASGGNSTTTFTLNINGGSTQNCGANQFANSLTATGTIGCGTPTAAATTSINSALGPLFNFVASSTGNVLSIASSTSGGSSTIQFLLQLQNYLTAALGSLNGATSSNQTVTGTNGISVSTVPGSTNSTTTISVTGPLTVPGANTSTITSDGTVSSIGGSLNASGTITSNGIPLGTSNVSTSSPNTWSAQQTLSAGVPTPLKVNGSETSTITGDASDSVVPHLNTIYYINPGYATLGCFGSSTTTDLGGCSNLAYALASGTMPTIVVPSISSTVAYSTPFVFGTNQEYADLQCPAGEALLYQGPSASSSFYFNEGQGSAGNTSYHVAHTAGNCHVEGATTPATNQTTTGATVGGTNGESGLDLSDMQFNNFGTGEIIATNTYMFSNYNPMFLGDVQEFVVNPGSNSGESIKSIGGTYGDCGNSTTSKCVYLSSTAVASAFFVMGSFDDAQFYDDTANSTAVLADQHLENPGRVQYGSYDFIIIANSTSDHFDLTDSELMQDGTSTQTVPGEYESNGAFTTAVGDTFESNHGSSTQYCFNETNGANSILVALGIRLKNNPCTSFDSSPLSANWAPSAIGLFMNGAGIVQENATNTLATTTISNLTVTGTSSIENGVLTNGGKLFAGTGFVNVSNTSTQSLLGTGVGTTTIPANVLQAGSTIHISMGGLINTSSTPTSSITLSLGGNSITSSIPTLPSSISSQRWTLNCDIVVQSGGSSGIWVPNCLMGAWQAGGNGSAESWGINNTTSSVNTTASDTIDLKYSWGGVSTVGNSVTSSAQLITVAP
jgi:hypothetical protein